MMAGAGHVVGIGHEAVETVQVAGWTPSTPVPASSLSDFNTNPFARSLRGQHVLSVDAFTRDQVSVRC
jgi:hypothetical protein